MEHLPAIVVPAKSTAPSSMTACGWWRAGRHELTSLADAILTVGSGDPGLTADSLANLRRSRDRSTFRCSRRRPASTARAPWPGASAHDASPLISATAYSVIEFPDLIRRHRVNGLPKIVADTGVELLGAQPEAALVDAVLTAR